LIVNSTLRGCHNRGGRLCHEQEEDGADPQPGRGVRVLQGYIDAPVSKQMGANAKTTYTSPPPLAKLANKIMNALSVQ
jgi:hypothetical protein